MIIDYTPDRLDVKEKKPLTGKYGRLEPLYPALRKGKHIYYYCKCDCGNYCIVGKDSIVSGHSKSCGCLKSDLLKQQHQQQREEKFIGKQFGQLQVISFHSFYEDPDNPRLKQANYLCKCLSCGKEFIARGCHIITGYTKSCGCVKSHGEKLIVDFLTRHNIVFYKEYSFPDLKDKYVLRFDFAFTNANGELFLVEYWGSQHTQLSNGFYDEIIVKHDQMKQEYCDNNNIHLYIIDYKDTQVVSTLKKIFDKEGVIYEL